MSTEAPFTPEKGHADLNTSMASVASTRSRKSGKRISELQKKFTTTGDSKTVDVSQVMTPMTQSETQRKVLEHEVKLWLEANVVSFRDF